MVAASVTDVLTAPLRQTPLAFSFKPSAFSQTAEGWQEKHNPEAAGPVRTMSSPYALISRKILF
jgi:hypothetical protein